ncbi:MAG: bifunctional diguanylate cyclase/phosphodiesterase [Pseudomonadota bacterium]
MSPDAAPKDRATPSAPRRTEAGPTPTVDAAAALAAAAGDAAALVLLDEDLSVIAVSDGFARLAGPSARPGVAFAQAFGAAGPPVAGLGPDARQVGGAGAHDAASPDIAAAPVALPSGGEALLVWTRRAGGGWTGVLTVLPGRGRPVREDPLTGLGDRTHLEAAYDRLVAERGDGPPPTVLCIDLDRFKQVNDLLGHGAGDALLRLAADRMRRALRDRDELARFGGDEFVALIAAPPDDSAVEAVAARIIEQISRPFLVQGRQALVGATVGMVQARIDADGAPTPLAEALQNADIALYEGKRAGRGVAVWFRPDMRARLDQARALEADLRRALVTDEFSIHYQPQHRTSDGALLGFEALLRWRHPKRGNVPPDVFVPVAERTRLITEIGGWVLEEACFAAADWPATLTIAVNVSPVQFLDPGFPGLVERALEESGLPPGRLELELTENVLLGEEQAVCDRIEALHGLGVRLSLDDFGTGYASLSYLRRYKFDTLKIDRSFMLSGERIDSELVQAVVDMGATLGLEVLAEGVETQSHLASLRDMGCPSVQGFHFGRPMPLDAARAYLEGRAEGASDLPEGGA